MDLKLLDKILISVKVAALLKWKFIKNLELYNGFLITIKVILLLIKK